MELIGGILSIRAYVFFIIFKNSPKLEFWEYLSAEESSNLFVFRITRVSGTGAEIWLRSLSVLQRDAAIY